MKLKKNSECLEEGTTWNMKLKKRNTKHKPRWGQRERDEEEGKS